jgi:ABC-type proline/glycine betaine transport system ATPase subunit
VTRYDMQQHFLKLRKDFDKAALFVTHDFARGPPAWLAHSAAA